MRFLSKDGHFGLHLLPQDVTRVRQLCSTAGAYETGGVLFGHYTDDRIWAEVTEITSAPDDSRSGRTWFERGTHRLQSQIMRLWREKKQFYLGEWHFHPKANPNPSSTDDRQLWSIAASDSYQCPEPVLLIVGGDPRGTWQIRCFVYPRGTHRVEMFLVADTDQAEELENGSEDTYRETDPA